MVPETSQVDPWRFEGVKRASSGRLASFYMTIQCRLPRKGFIRDEALDFLRGRCLSQIITAFVERSISAGRVDLDDGVAFDVQSV